MKKSWIKSLCLILLIVIVGLAFLSACNEETESQERKLKILDKNYSSLEELNLAAPFDFNVIDNYMIREFSTDNHKAIDFFSYGGVEAIPFLAMQDSYVMKVEVKKMEQNGSENWAVSVIVGLNSKYGMIMVFETFSPDDEIGAKQTNNIFVKEGDYIKKGDIIGNLIVGDSDSSHVHFNIFDFSNNKWSHVKPEPFFTKEAIEQISSRLESTLKK